MRKLITLSLAVLLMGLSAAVVFAAVQSGDDASPTTGTTETTETTTTPQHQQRERHRERRRDRERERGDDIRHNDDPVTDAVDVSGPCDEAEHANDPRCTGAPTGVVPKVDDHGGDRDQVEEHSGPGRGDDDGEVDDHSGSGHGGDDHGGDDHGEDD